MARCSKPAPRRPGAVELPLLVLGRQVRLLLQRQLVEVGVGQRTRRAAARRRTRARSRARRRRRSSRSMLHSTASVSIENTVPGVRGRGVPTCFARDAGCTAGRCPASSRRCRRMKLARHQLDRVLDLDLEIVDRHREVAERLRRQHDADGPGLRLSPRCTSGLLRSSPSMLCSSPSRVLEAARRARSAARSRESNGRSRPPAPPTST